MRPAFRRFYVALLVLSVLPWLGIVLLAQDSTATPTIPNANATLVLALAGLAAFVAQAIGSWLVSQWNKIGGWLEERSNGSKRFVAVALTGALGLATNGILSLMSTNTNWLAATGLSVVAGVVSVLTTGLAIDTAKARMLATQRSGRI